MNRSPIFRTLLLCLVLVSALTAAQTLLAQAGNLLTNPGFEKPFQAVTGSTSSMIAQGWTAWALQQGQNKEPEYYPASDTTNGMPTPRIHSGSDAQQYFSYFAPHIGGVYQTVSGVNAGDQLTFSIYAYVWSSNGTTADTSDGSGQISFQVGIDPNGGTDATNSAIVWSTAETTYDKYAQYSVTATAAGSSVTVFVRSIVNKVTMNNVIYIDDASLTVTGSGALPSAASTASAESTTAPELATAAVLPSTEVVLPPTAQVTAEATTAVPLSTEIVVPPTVEMTTEITAEASAAATILPFETTVLPTEAVTEAVSATPEVTLPPTLQIVPITVEVTEAATVPASVTEATTPEVTVAVPTELVTAPVVPPTEIPTNTPTDTATFTEIPTNTPTQAPTNTPTNTPTEGPSLTPTNTPTASNTPLPTNTFTPSSTPQPSSTPTPSPTLDQTQFPYLLQYTVVRGDTVSALATRFGSTVSAIIIVNQLGADARIYVTQKLVIPVQTLPQTSTPVQPGQPTSTPTALTPPTLIPTPTETAIVVQPAASSTTEGQAQTVLIMTSYTVRYGDTLSTIAVRFGLTTQQLADANDIVNPNLVRVGQILKIPQLGTATPMPTSTPVPSSTTPPIILPTATSTATAIPVQPMTYQVQPGDNLYRISVKLNVPIVQLIEANGILDANRIFVGQILIIP
ncbi:MAG TPA: LysM peptidoglycan-binding domain-containing protein [Phototrophicaceae bacterium]|nr:LysM peptidoglycan-binding domain-containing protein [Phototrophicaceae bacterium]